MKRSHLSTAILITALVVARLAHASAELEIQPASPTSDDYVNVLVHINGCENFPAISPAIGSEIIAWFVPVDFEHWSCPAIDDPRTVSLPVGKLAPGNYTVNMYDAATETQPLLLRDSLTFTVAAGPSSTLSLHQGRFEAQVTWRTSDGKTGSGKVVPGASDESGLLWFFGPANWELVLKVLDGCGVNGRFWVLGAGATNVEFTVEIVDTLTHETWTYTNPSGHPAGSFFDTAAFGGACHAPPPAP